MSTSNKENQINDGRKPLSSIINKPNNTTHDQAKQPLKNNNNSNKPTLTNSKIPPLEIKSDLSIEKEIIKSLESQLKKKEETILQLKNQLLNVKDEKIEELELQLKLKEETILQLENQILIVIDESNSQLEIKNQLLNEKDEEILIVKDQSNQLLNEKDEIISGLSSNYEDLKKLFINEVFLQNKKEKNDKINLIQNNGRIRMIHKLKNENNELKKEQHDHQHHHHQHQHQSSTLKKSSEPVQPIIVQQTPSTINNYYGLEDYEEHVGEC